jgi:hypothetical protein
MNYRGLILVVLLFVAGIFGCATTEVTAVWKDGAYQSQPKKVLVISLFKDQTVRRMAEDEFKSHLKFSGVDAATGYEVFSGSELPTKEKVVEQVKAGGYDAVLLTRLIDTRTERRAVSAGPTYAAPHYGMSYGGYYGQGYSTIYATTYQVDDKFAVVESNLYDAATEKLVWTATSDTWMADANQKLVKDFVAIMMGSLRKQKIVR